MKTSTIYFRKGISIALIAIITGTLFASCKKDSSTTTGDISDDEVAEAVTETVSGSSAGMATQTETSARMVSASGLGCGGSSDTTISGQSQPGAAITYNFNLNFHRALTCNNGVPSQFSCNFTGSSSYTATRMSSNDNSSAQLTVTGLEPSSGSYVLNETYTRNGTQQSSVRYQRSFSSTITYTASNITVDKSTLKIVSGTASVQFTGSSSTGGSVSRGGTLTFLGNNQATLALNNGNTYTIQW